ncbi:MAG: matrixin family metalloprotease [Balneolaceae bacterium]|nr:matrixin family metalloprotease [Balneolaceae bacterium]
MSYKMIIPFTLFILVAGSFAMLNSRYSISISPQAVSCSDTLTWKIGSVDSRYEITDETIRNLMNEAGKLWSDAAGKQLIRYHPEGEIVLNFIYTEGQVFTQNRKQLAKRIEQQEQEFHALRTKYNRLSPEYDAKLTDYKRRLEAYNRKVNKFNITVSDLNSDGMITDSKKRSLDKEKRHILEIKKELEREREKLNELKDTTNQLVEKLNNHVDQMNALIYHFNEKYSNRKEFDQGRYIKFGDIKKINIYQFDNRANLTLALAHEIGHALGINHVKNPKSVMYYLMEKQDQDNITLSEEDLAALRAACGESL